ncbi:MAG: hypothetical protein AAF585_21765, partial [Verrucomicrobiota bacterium]
MIRIFLFFCAVGIANAQQAELPQRFLERLGVAPDWMDLDPFQRTITRDEFVKELVGNYADTEESATKFIEILDDRARIMENTKRPGLTYDLVFAEKPLKTPPKRYWRSAQQLPVMKDADKPLEGMRILVDPGHIGGEFAKMEARWFLIGKEGETENKPVMEGEIVLRVGEILKEELTQLGARVAMSRRVNAPAGKLRPQDFYDYAKVAYNFPPDTDPEEDINLQRAAQRLFYLSSEIRARAKRLNEEFRPDLALCLHVNAEAWGDPADPDFVDRNHFHILTNGCYSAGEIQKDDQRYELLRRLLQRTHSEELAVSSTVAEHMSAAIALPAFTYKGSNAKLVGENPYVWSRNLLATRVFECPVVFFEPYVMNNQIVHDRVQAGEYS